MASVSPEVLEDGGKAGGSGCGERLMVQLLPLLLPLQVWCSPYCVMPAMSVRADATEQVWTLCAVVE